MNPDAIERLVVGETPTLLEADKGNELIDRLNALANIEIEPGETDEILWGEDSVKIIYKFPPDGWEEKVVTLCVEGEEEEFTFIVREGEGY